MYCVQENVRVGKPLNIKEREEETYTDSRWNTVIRDIAEVVNNNIN